MRIFSYWSGPVSWIERLSAASAVATGHDLTVFSYEPEKLRAEGLNAVIEDAREILPGGPDGIHPSHFSDHFRVEGLARGLGAWADLDLIFIKSLPADDYLFGWQSPGRICGAVLRLPKDSAVLNSYLELCRRGPLVDYVMPWFPWHLKLRRHIRSSINTLTGGRKLAPKYGPVALTHFIEQHDLVHLTKSQKVFYPIASDKSVLATVLRDGAVEHLVGPETVCVHLWRSMYQDLHGPDAPRTGWISKQLSRYSL
jgi:hypothetical protein